MGGSQLPLTLLMALLACVLQDRHSQNVAREDLEVLGRTKSKARARATLDELLDTLRLLEEEPEPLPRPKTYHKDRYAWTDEVHRHWALTPTV